MAVNNMEPSDWQKIVDSMQLIADDAETDAKSLDGMRLDGYSVGTQFGNQLAMIKAQACAIQRIARYIQGEERR